MFSTTERNCGFRSKRWGNGFVCAMVQGYKPIGTFEIYYIFGHTVESDAHDTREKQQKNHQDVFPPFPWWVPPCLPFLGLAAATPQYWSLVSKYVCDTRDGIGQLPQLIVKLLANRIVLTKIQEEVTRLVITEAFFSDSLHFCMSNLFLFLVYFFYYDFLLEFLCKIKNRFNTKKWKKWFWPMCGCSFLTIAFDEEMVGPSDPKNVFTNLTRNVLQCCEATKIHQMVGFILLICCCHHDYWPSMMVVIKKMKMTVAISDSVDSNMGATSTQDLQLIFLFATSFLHQQFSILLLP